MGIRCFQRWTLSPNCGPKSTPEVAELHDCQATIGRLLRLLLVLVALGVTLVVLLVF
jgi:hypothetical protein